jgi:hypothetical protein
MCTWVAPFALFHDISMIYEKENLSRQYQDIEDV